MLSRLSKLCAVLVLGVSFSYAATVAEVQAFVEDGVKLCKEKGNEACLKEFNNKDGAFIKGELYMFAYDFNGVNQALGSNPKLVGKNLYKLKDASGLMLIQELIKIAKTDGEGWLDYKWSHPIKKKIADKRSYIKRIDGDMFIGTGFYK
ncbi:cache domain-containing protein [Arcobacter sp. LA11]|uniref:cache domain-containing protein n=1 Tax=Arcobacter sp. LA11 TaxID=1898176 RepID=UPI000933626D|nr:cache domain-containing protein [Arcobacter sp. LA11]